MRFGDVSHIRGWPCAAVSIVAVILCAGPLIAESRPDASTRPVWADRRTNTLGMPSLDGRFLSFTDWETGDIAIRDLRTGEETRLTNNEANPNSGEYAYFSTVSPDGRRVAYAWFNEEKYYDLRVIDIPEPASIPLLPTAVTEFPDAPGLLRAPSRPDSLTRSAVRAKPRILYRSDQVQFIKPAAWSRDGKYILALFFGKSILNRIVLIDVEDGSVKVLKRPFWIYPKRMSLSPDGRYVVYGLNQQPPHIQRDIFLLPTDGSPETTLVKHPANDLFPMWTPDGRGVLFASDRDGTLDMWLQSVAGGKPSGPPVKVKKDIGRMMPLGFTEEGSFYYGLRTGDEDAYVVSLDPETSLPVGTPEHVSSRYRNVNRSPDWSPDGSSLAYLTHVGTENQGLEFRVISIRSLKTGEERQLGTPRLSYLNWLRWAPDGVSFLVGGSDTKNLGGLFRIDAETGKVTPLAQAPYAPPRGYLGVWSRDGKGIFYVHEDLRETSVSLRYHDMATNEEKKLYEVARPWRINNLSLSPDGRNMAFGISKNNRTEAQTLLVMPSQGGEPREVFKVKKPLLSGVAWSRDGKHLLFSRAAHPTPRMWRVPVEGGAARPLGLATDTNARISVHPDGHRIAYTAGRTNLEVWVMENFLPKARASR